MKQAYELKDFSAGTVTNGDLADIPDGASSYSINISPTSKLGAAETIKGHKEEMTNVPPISAMVVRDGLDESHTNLAVNINALFILIESYPSDTMLGDFVAIAEEGQLLPDTDPNNVPPWNTDADGDYLWAVIDTIDGYGYDVSGSVEVVGTLTTDGYVAMIPAGTDVNGAYLDDADVEHIPADLPETAFTFSVNKTFSNITYATSTKSVVILYKGEGGTSVDFIDGFRAQFSKGAYLWGEFGTNLDLTETERGLFIGSSTSRPYVQHKQRDKDGDVFNYLVESECKPPTAQNALSNIDQMVWAKDTTRAKYGLFCMIYGMSKIWQLVQNTTTGPAVDYYEFTASDEYGGTFKGFGGLAECSEDNRVWSWDFEGWNLYKLILPDDTHDSQEWSLSTDASFSLKLDEMPENGWIASVAECKCNLSTTGSKAMQLYILFTRPGGLQQGDVVLGVIDIYNDDGTPIEGTRSITPIYTIPSYSHVTAYTHHAFGHNWLGIRNDVDPRGPVDMYWTIDSSAQPVAYHNGGFADLTHYTQYGFMHDVCWVNTDKEKVMLDVGEGALAVTTQLGADHDCVWFSVEPLGATAYMEYSGAWRLAKQWPNLWFDTHSDGHWTNQTAGQNIVTNTPYLISVCPQATELTDKSIETFDMVEVPADAAGAEYIAAWDTTIDRMNEVEAGVYTGLSEEELAQVGPFKGSAGPGSQYMRDTAADCRVMMGHMSAVLNSSTWADCKSSVASYHTGSTMNGKINALINFMNLKAVTYANYVPGGTTDDDDSPGSYEYKTVNPLHSFHQPFASDLPMNDHISARSRFRNLFNQLNNLKNYAGAATISKFNHNQINHTPIDTSFPMQKAFTQLQSYDGDHIVGSLLDQGIMKHSDAVITTSGTSISDKLINTTLAWKNYYTDNDGGTAGDGGNGIFSTPVIDSETNETQEATEGWSIYKPSGTDYVTPHFSGTGNDGLQEEGILTSVYTGDLLLKNYVYDNTSSIENIFDSGDIAVGLKITEPAAIAVDDLFKTNETYLYNMSFLYDGYQEGPLMSTPVTVGPLTKNSDWLDILVKVRNKNPRVTHVQVYSKSEAAEKFRLLKSVALDTDWVPANPNLVLGTGSADMEMTNTVDLEMQDKQTAGISYEALTGMPEKLRDTMVPYAESEAMGSYLFIANCRHPKLPDASRMIFRSEPGKFSLFNWAVNYLGMPENIHTLQSHNNRLYAFSNKTMFRIDGFNMVLEQEFPGMGIRSNKSICSMDGLMYLANKNGLYVTNAGKVKKLSQTVDDKWADIFENFPSAVISLAVDKKYNSILCLFDNAGTESIDLTPTEALVFTPDKQKWDIWEMPARVKSQCINENNELMICASSSSVVGFNEEGRPISDLDDEDSIVINPYSLYTLHTGTGYVPFKWTTKELTLGQDTRRKKYKTVKVVGKDVTLGSVYIDGLHKSYADIPPDDESGPQDNKYKSWKLPVLDTEEFSRVGKHIRIRVIDTYGNAEDVDSDLNESYENSAILKNVSITYSNKTLK